MPTPQEIQQNRYRLIALMKSGRMKEIRGLILGRAHPCIGCAVGAGILSLGINKKTWGEHPDDAHEIVSREFGISPLKLLEIEAMFEGWGQGEYSLSEIADYLIKEHGFPTVEEYSVTEILETSPLKEKEVVKDGTKINKDINLSLV